MWEISDGSAALISGLPWEWGFPFPWDGNGNGNEVFPCGNLHRNPVGIPMGILMESCGNTHWNPHCALP